MTDASITHEHEGVEPPRNTRPSGDELIYDEDDGLSCAFIYDGSTIGSDGPSYSLSSDRKMGFKTTRLMRTQLKQVGKEILQTMEEDPVNNVFQPYGKMGDLHNMEDSNKKQ